MPRTKSPTIWCLYRLITEGQVADKAATVSQLEQSLVEARDLIQEWRESDESLKAEVREAETKAQEAEKRAPLSQSIFNYGQYNASMSYASSQIQPSNGSS